MQPPKDLLAWLTKKHLTARRVGRSGFWNLSSGSSAGAIRARMILTWKAQPTYTRVNSTWEHGIDVSRWKQLISAPGVPGIIVISERSTDSLLLTTSAWVSAHHRRASPLVATYGLSGMLYWERDAMRIIGPGGSLAQVPPLMPSEDGDEAGQDLLELLK